MQLYFSPVADGDYSNPVNLFEDSGITVPHLAPPDPGDDIDFLGICTGGPPTVIVLGTIRLTASGGVNSISMESNSLITELGSVSSGAIFLVHESATIDSEFTSRLEATGAAPAFLLNANCVITGGTEAINTGVTGSVNLFGHCERPIISPTIVIEEGSTGDPSLTGGLITVSRTNAEFAGDISSSNGVGVGAGATLTGIISISGSMYVYGTVSGAINGTGGGTIAVHGASEESFGTITGAVTYPNGIVDSIGATLTLVSANVGIFNLRSGAVLEGSDITAGVVIVLGGARCSCSLTGQADVRGGGLLTEGVTGDVLIASGGQSTATITGNVISAGETPPGSNIFGNLTINNPGINQQTVSGNILMLPGASNYGTCEGTITFPVANIGGSWKPGAAGLEISAIGAAINGFVLTGIIAGGGGTPAAVYGIEV